VRYGKHIGLTERRMTIAQYVFRRRGALIVFFGRFVAVLRSIVALLAGANRMQWAAFVVFNSAGAVVWAALYGFTAFYFTNQVKRLSGPVGTVVAILAAVIVVAAAIWAHFHRDELEKKAAEVVKARGG
jgi:membrane protein DedA with SNARE-associated domain